MPEHDPRNLRLSQYVRDWLDSRVTHDPSKLSYLILPQPVYRHQLDLEARLLGLSHSGLLANWELRWLPPNPYYLNSQDPDWEVPRSSAHDEVVEVDTKGGFSFLAVTSNNWYDGGDRTGPKSTRLAMPLFDQHSVDLFLAAATRGSTALMTRASWETRLICLLGSGVTDQQVIALEGLVDNVRNKHAVRMLLGLPLTRQLSVDTQHRPEPHQWVLASPHASKEMRDLLTHRMQPGRWQGPFAHIMSADILLKKAQGVRKGVLNVNWLRRLCCHSAIVDEPDKLVGYLPMIHHPEWLPVFRSLVKKTDLADRLRARPVGSILELPRFHVREI